MVGKDMSLSPGTGYYQDGKNSTLPISILKKSVNWNVCEVKWKRGRSGNISKIIKFFTTLSKKYRKLKIWVVVVAQLVEQSILIPEVHRSNLNISKILKWRYLLLTVKKARIQKNEAANDPLFFKKTGWKPPNKRINYPKDRQRVTKQHKDGQTKGS